MTEVTLSQILHEREERVHLQQQFLKENAYPLLCFTMNIAGPVKNTPLIQRGFRRGLDLLAQQIPEELILKRHVHSDVTGNTAIFSVNMDAQELKKICTGIEDAAPVGRLFDMDVLDASGVKLERPSLRGCLVCGAPGRACAAGRLHSVAQLQDKTNQILLDHFKGTDPAQVAHLAVQSLIDEVNTTPKPGLVDRNNNGSHKDMTLSHFLASAHALRGYFADCMTIGQNTAHMPPQDTFPRLRKAGLEAEKAMFQATGGVNTHKGLIYTMGILCGSIGRLWSADAPIASVTAICEESAKIVSESVSADFSTASGATPGERLYLEQGLRGIRGEVASGLKSITEIALPCYKNTLSSGLSSNDAGVLTLLHLIANVEDTNLYHRGGAEGTCWAKKAAAEILADDIPHIHQLEALDQAFIERNLSPGGCADLLAVTYFLHKIQNG